MSQIHENKDHGVGKEYATYADLVAVIWDRLSEFGKPVTRGTAMRELLEKNKPFRKRYMGSPHCLSILASVHVCLHRTLNIISYFTNQEK